MAVVQFGKINCGKCGQEKVVTYDPREGLPVHCNECCEILRKEAEAKELEEFLRPIKEMTQAELDKITAQTNYPIPTDLENFIARFASVPQDQAIRMLAGEVLELKERQNLLERTLVKEIVGLLASEIFRLKKENQNHIHHQIMDG